MEKYLDHDNLWDVTRPNDDVNDPVPTDVHNEKMKERKALCKIALMAEASCVPHIRTAKTPREAWANLQSAYEDISLMRRLRLLHKLFSIKLQEHGSVQDYVMQVMLLAQQISDISDVLDDEFIAIIMLSGLTSNYDPMVSYGFRKHEPLSVQIEPTGWYIDSGATSHMTKHKDWLLSHENESVCMNVTVAKNDKLKTAGNGDVLVKLKGDKEAKVISNVLYVPELSANLLSVSNPHVPSELDEAGLACSVSRDPSVEVWHKRLGHLNILSMKLLRNGMASGIDFSGESYDKPCESCALGKQTRQPFKSLGPIPRFRIFSKEHKYANDQEERRDLGISGGADVGDAAQGQRLRFRGVPFLGAV
ncbi:hypothetical protein J437_LFUL018516, partial [Ladona fulva]